MSAPRVSRETPAPPSAARALLAEHVDAVASYAGLLADAGVVRGLIGPREVPRLWERHLLNCAVVARSVPAGTQVADVGTGAGLPGLVWALVRPDLQVTLIEPLLRRTTFLLEAVGALGVANVEVVRARAEDLHGSGASYDVVTSRAVAPLDRLARWCLPLVRVGGLLVAMKGERAADELAEHAGVLASLGCPTAEVREFAVAGSVTRAVVGVRETEGASAARPTRRR